MTATETESYWTAKLAPRDPIDAQKHARMFAAKLTKYDLLTAQAAYDAWAEAHDDYVRSYRDFWAAVNAVVPKEDRKYPAWERDAPDSVQAAMLVHSDVFSVTPSIGSKIIGMRRYSVEIYPLSRWASDARKYRSGATKLRKAAASIS